MRAMFRPLLHFVAACAACLGGAQALAAGPIYSHLYAFGDSYLDNGAALRLSQQALSANVPGAQLLPAAPHAQLYWEGRWSDGPSAVEQLASRLGIGISDFAVGGARSGDGNYYAWLDAYSDSGLLGQVRAYIESQPAGRVDPRGLYLLAASANDFFQMVDFKRSETPQRIAERAAANTAHALALLADAGARTVMVSGAYLLDQVPAVAGDAPARAAAQAFMAAYDAALTPALAAVTRRHRLRVLRFRWAEAMRQMIAHAAQLGLSDVSTPCQATLPKPAPACAQAAAHLWWDEYHPTRRAHALIAADMARALGLP